MKILRPFLICFGGASIASCTVYIKDVFTGDPSGPTYSEAYRNAVADGVNPNSAHRQALLASSVRDTKVTERKASDRQKDQERERRGEKNSKGLIDWRWD
ncbi:MAG: hypothetical protein AB8D78_12555 [Akkermansiaceae bacterium]